MSMTWPQIISTMRKQGWEVDVASHWVDVVTSRGKQGGFERSSKGLQAACEFYEQQHQFGRFAQAPSRSIPASRRVVTTTNRRVTASFVILACFAVIVPAIYHGLMVPVHGLACLIVMLVALLIVMCFARRVL